MTDMNIKMEQMMVKMQNMMDGMNMEEMFNSMPQMDEFSPTPGENEIIVPEQQKIDRPTGTRI